MTPHEIISKLREGIPANSSIIQDRIGGVKIENDWEALKALVDEAAALIETLLAENERLKADRDRLDWLFSDLNDESIAAKLLQVGNAYALRVDDCNDFRGAIDAVKLPPMDKGELK